MIRPLTRIAPDERSEAVANLHAAMEAMGFPVAASERDERRAGEDTIRAVRLFQRQMNLEIDEALLVDEFTAASLNFILSIRGQLDEKTRPRRHTVAGVVSTAGGQPARGLLVTAYDQQMRKRVSIGAAHTDANGRYSIAYDPSRTSKADLTGVDLVVEVTSAAGAVLYTSSAQFNRAYSTVIDVVLPAANVSEFDAITAAFNVLIQGQDVTLATLEEDGKTDDITFAAGETGIAYDRLMDFAIAQRLGAKGKLPPSFWHAVLRTGAIAETLSASPDPAGLDALAQDVLGKVGTTPASAISAGLARAVAANIIAVSTQQITAWMRAYGDVQAGGQSGATSTASQLGAVIGLSGDAQTAFASALAAGGSSSDILARLQADKALTADQLSATQATLAVHDLVLGDLALVKALKDKVPTAAAAPALAKLGADDWVAAIKQAGAPPPAYVAGAADADKQANYASLLSTRVAAAYPTAAFGGRLSAAANPALTQAPKIAAFLDAHPDFEFATTSIDGYLKSKATAEFANEPADGDFIQQLKAAQRVFKLAPNFDATNTLLADNLHSANQIYRLGKTQFINLYQDKPGFTAAAAEQAFHRAANTYGAMATLLGELRATQHANQVQGLANPAPALNDLPDWSDLFGPGDFCACEDCRSIFSPAAYLTDLLKWLEARKLNGTATSAKDILFKRRPDLGQIELSCDNSLVELPYIDLACEIMEDLVAPWILLNLPAGTAFAAGPVTNALQQAFAAAAPIDPNQPHVTLSAAARVYGPDHFGAWLVRDGDVTYRAVPGGGGVAVSILRQTHGPSEDLMAYPEYTNQAAYKILGAADYPMALPFDLYTESVRAYLGLATLTRAQVMQTFRGKNAADPADLDIACEYIRVSAGEQALIFTADPGHQYLYWGQPDNPTALAQLSKVDVFLQATGLDFNGMQTLLSLGFVNPGGAIVVQNLDGSCDTAMKRLQVLDAPALDRIHRFLRLWRKLGWKMWEVDLVIRNAGLGAGHLDTSLPPKLMPFLQLKARLGTLSIEQMCAFFDDLNTTAKFTAAYQKPTPSLYEQLYLNTRTSGPIDSAFAIATVSGGAPKVIDDHLPRILAADKVKAADLVTLRALTKPGPAPAPLYIDNSLTLHNLSFLYRHAMFSRGLGVSASDWARLLLLLQVDPFTDTATAFAFAQTFDRLKKSGFTLDQLTYLLTLDPTAKAAAAAKSITATLGALKASLQSIAAAYDPAQAPSDLAALGDAIAAQLQVLGWDAGSAANAVAVLNGSLQLSSLGPAAPAIVFPPGIPATFDPVTRKIYFAGVMTDAQQTQLLTAAGPPAILADPNYVAAINELHDLPRLLIKLYVPAFSAPLRSLPAAVQFTSLDKSLAARISYDQDTKTLSFFGVMTRADQVALTALSGDPAYHGAIGMLYLAPRTGPAAADHLWMGPAELVANMPLAETRLLTFLARKLSTDQVVQQMATAFGLTQATTAYLLTNYPLFGGGPGRDLMQELLDPAFVSSGAGVTIDTFPLLFQDYVWLHRTALVLKTVSAVDSDFQWIVDGPAAKGILDFSALPLVAGDASATSPAQLKQLLGLAEFMAFHHGWSDGKTSLLDMVDRLISDATYTSALFGADLEALTGWEAADGQALADQLDLSYPAAYRTSDGWRRLNDAFTIIQQVSGAAPGLLALAKRVVGEAEDESLRGMLRAQYSEQDWLTNNQAVQNGLRERKRDSLIAYLMAKGAPANAPNAPWTDPNDLFDCYLIDVQMCSCMPTTRVVQAYAAVQLFVQRCLMGLEPDARANVEADDGWAQWEWMKFYRLWEANRMVFAYPENYAEPELRKDKSDLFQNLENAILQNGVTKDNVEQAFLNYLEGLDDVAQLEIAGTYYQEDNQTLHVFGRSAGGDPRLYYYRQFISGRRWTPWSKVDLDIKGDYLTPFVFDERLYAIWLEFQPGQSDTQTAAIPSPSDHSVQLTSDGGAAKTMSVYLAISELRNGKWTTKRLADAPFESDAFTGAYDETQFLIAPLDLTWLPETLFPGGLPTAPVPAEYQWLVQPEFLILVRNLDSQHGHTQLFQMAGCRGYPEDFEGNLRVMPVITTFQNSSLDDDRNVSDGPGVSTPATDLTPNAGTLLPPFEILANLPSQFKVSYPHYMSLFDRLIFLFGVLGAVNHNTPTIVAKGDGGRVKALLGTFYDWFYADSRRTFHVRPEIYLKKQKLALYYEDIVDFFQAIGTKIAPGQWPAFIEILLLVLRDDLAYQLRFSTSYHPLTCKFISSLYSGGIDLLMSRETQFADAGLNFNNTYSPTAMVDSDYPDETVLFDDPADRYAHGYASYNWELFYFAPVMVAERLSANQQFEDAMSWYHYVFDPTGGHDVDPITHALATAPQKYWITKPFYQRQSADYLQQRIENLMALLANDPSSPTDPSLLLQLQNEVQDWRKDPFDPHLIAQYRTVAYQKFVVMKYLDNLIAWGDQQFTLDTMESVNIATQLYVLAAHILGKRPEVVPPAAKPVPETFNELDDSLDAFSNAMIQFENLLPPMPGQGGGTLPAAGLPAMLYFCIPQNDQLLAYWDTVDDRLYKIRHCLNIDGVFSPPVLFPPPINPMDLVRAAAMGGDLSSALADLDAPVPYYRFSTMLQMANQVVGDVKALGAALLTALEKKDAEALALLRQGQEISLLQAVRAVKQQQIDDANITLAALKKSQELASQKFQYYSSRPFMNAGESAAAGLNAASLAIDAAIATGYALSGGLKLVPDFMIGAAGFGGSPTANAATGGQSFGGSAEDAVKTIQSIAAALDKAAGVASVVAGYQRRMDDWQFQAQSASKELEQIAQQILGAEKKIAIAETELANQDLQIAHSQAVNSFMQSKYTNEDLYQWQIGQVSQTYFASYNLACSIAKNAEKCFGYELGVENTAYIQPGYWNSLRSGLEAGEALQLDLRRMENDYRTQNRREFECVKHISLAQINPQALANLKAGGAQPCQFDLQEELFDLDFPGHYFRRIKSVSLSIPCVAGPYTTVNATLRLLKNMVRINTSGATYEHANDGGVFTDDDRFRQSNVRVTAIAASTGQNDSGMFELNFHDERYLPFEGAGAISSWQIDMMDDAALRQFDYATISDVIIHVRYTAREDAGDFRNKAKQHLHDVISGAEPQLPQWRLFDLMREFPTEWYAMLNPPAGGAQTLSLQITRQQFPFLAQGKTVHLQSAMLVSRNQKALSVVMDPPFANTDPAANPPGTRIALALPAGAPGAVYSHGGFDSQDVVLDETAPWSLQFLAAGTLAPTDIAECYLAVGYTLQ